MYNETEVRVAKSSPLSRVRSQGGKRGLLPGTGYLRQVMADGVWGPVLAMKCPLPPDPQPWRRRGRVQPGLWAMFWTAEISPHTHQSCSITCPASSENNSVVLWGLCVPGTHVHINRKFGQESSKTEIHYVKKWNACNKPNQMGRQAKGIWRGQRTLGGEVAVGPYLGGSCGEQWRRASQVLAALGTPSSGGPGWPGGFMQPGSVMPHSRPVEAGTWLGAVWAASGNALAWSSPGQKLTEKGFSAIFVQIGVERNGQVTWAKKTRPKIHRVRTFYKKQVESRWIKGLCSNADVW